MDYLELKERYLRIIQYKVNKIDLKYTLKKV